MIVPFAPVTNTGIMSPSTVDAASALAKIAAKYWNWACTVACVYPLSASIAASWATPAAPCVTSASPIAMLSALPSTLHLHLPNTQTCTRSPAKIPQ